MRVRYIGLILSLLIYHPGGGAGPAHATSGEPSSPHIHYATADRATFVVGTVIESNTTANGQFHHTFQIVASSTPGREAVLSVFGNRLPGMGTFLLPLTVEAGQWTLMAPVTAIHELGVREAPSALKVLLRWRQQSDAPVIKRLDSWLGWISHPVVFIRRASLQALRYHREELRSVMTPSRVAALTAAYEDAEASTEERRKLLSLIGLIGGDAGADWVARSLYTHISADQRTRALHILGRSDTPLSLTTLRECAERKAAGTAVLCRRLFARRKAADQYR